MIRGFLFSISSAVVCQVYLNSEVVFDNHDTQVVSVVLSMDVVPAFSYLGINLISLGSAEDVFC